MSKPTFVQRSRLGSAIFQIDGAEIEVAEYYFWRKGTTRTRLRHLQPEFSRVTRAMPLLLVVPFGVMLIGCIGVWWLLQQDDLPKMLAMWSGGFALVGLYAALVHSPAVTYYEFKDHWARGRFRLFRERAQAAECDAFVAELALRIRAAHGDLSAEALQQALADGPYSAHEKRPPTSRDLKGHCAVGCGILANAVLLIPGATPINGAFILIFPLVCGGLVFGLLSLSVKGKSRVLGGVGIVLALLPFLAMP